MTKLTLLSAALLLASAPAAFANRDCNEGGASNFVKICTVEYSGSIMNSVGKGYYVKLEVFNVAGKEIATRYIYTGIQEKADAHQLITSAACR